MDKQEINRKFYEMFSIMMDNRNKSRYEESLVMVEDFLSDVETFDEKTFKEVFSEGFYQVISGDNYPKLPSFFMFDLLQHYVEKTISNGTGNIYQKRRASIVKRIKELRKKTLSLPYDERFDPNYTLTNNCVEDITRSKGVFYFDFRNIKDIGMDDYDVLKDNSIENISVMYYYADIPSELFEVKNGKMRSIETSMMHVDGIVFEEDKELLEEEYVESMQEYANDIIDELSDFFDGVVPKTYEEAKQQLMKKGYNQKSYPDLYKAVVARYIYLKEKSIKNRETIELYTKKLYLYKRNSKIKPAKKKEEVKRTGLFFGLSRDSKYEKTEKPRVERVKAFDYEREEQMAKDKELIDVVIYQRRTINGKKYMTELSNEEYNVVRR